METYFHSDPRLAEWVDQIIEKVFTVCLLTGADAEAEFAKGCQIISKITHLLQGISVFPLEYLEDGLQQLLEQQLPDSRVINNFPAFQATMSKMLSEGMTRAIDSQKLQVSEAEQPLEVELQTSEVEQPLEVELQTSEVEQPLEVELQTSEAEQPLKVELQTSEAEQPMASIKGSPAEIALPSISTKPYGLIRKVNISEQADRLNYVLNNIFPDVSVRWNLNLMGQTFLAQVEDILIYLDNPELPCQVENFNQQGWQVYVCSPDDLKFPRRLEREIRKRQRFSKQIKKR